MKRLRYITLLALIFIGFAACSSLKPQAPSVTVRSISIQQWGFPAIIIGVKLVVANPNLFDINVANVDYTFLVSGESVLVGKINENILLRAKSSEAFNISVSLDLLKLLPSVPQILAKQSLPYSIEGNVWLANRSVPLPFSRSGVLSPE